MGPRDQIIEKALPLSYRYNEVYAGQQGGIYRKRHFQVTGPTTPVDLEGRHGRLSPGCLDEVKRSLAVVVFCRAVRRVGLPRMNTQPDTRKDGPRDTL